MLSNMKIKRSSYDLSYYHILIYIISHLWSGTDSELAPGYSIDVPRRVTVQRGLCVYIPCSFTVPETERLTRNAMGIWYNEDANAVASKSTTRNETNGRFSLVGDVWRGDCTLYIEDPLYEDEGRYRFRVEDNIKFVYQDIQPYVEVTGLTSKPEISPIKSWREGEKVTLRCTSPGTCVGITPQITWTGNIQNGKVENKVKNHENGTKTYLSTITFTARKEQNNSPLSCTVQLKGGLSTAQQITMKVEYPPRAPEIKCSINNKEPNIPSSSGCTMDANNTIYPPEGSQISLTCSADSLPESSLVWKSSIRTLIFSSMGKLIITNLSLTDEGIYTCQATNAHGKSETSVTIKITSKHISEMKSYCKITGNHIECTCIIQSFPEASIQWKIDDKFYDSSDEGIHISTSRSDLVTNSTLSLQLSQKDIPYVKCISSNNYRELVLDLLYKKSSTDYKVIVGIVTGNLIILLLIALGLFWYVKRHMKKKLDNNDTHELGNTRGTESEYQDLQKPTNSIYHTIVRSEQ